MPSADVLHWICNVPIGILFCGFGICGNLLSIFVWKRVIRKNLQGNPSTAIYLITLGFCDIGLLVFFLLSESIPTANPSVKATFFYAAFFSWFTFPLLYVFVVASIWIIVGVTINRWVLIAFPTRAKDIYSKTKTYFSIFIILFLSVLINIPHWFNFKVVHIANETYAIAKTEYGTSKGAVNYEFWCHCIVLVLAPWFTIAILNTAIIKKLRDRSRKINFVKNKPERQKQDGNLTVMLLAVTFTFLILIAWQCVSQCFFMLEYGKMEDMNIWYRVDKSYAFGKLGVVINSSINSIFYCWYGSSFRKELRESISASFSFVTMTPDNSWSTKEFKSELRKGAVNITDEVPRMPTTTVEWKTLGEDKTLAAVSA